MEKQDIQKAAERYVGLGLPVIPICSYDHGGESFQHRNICQYSGKVPVIMNWQARTTTSLNEVGQWYNAHPKRNIGLPMGNASRLIGVDIDGEAGESFLAELSRGDVPDTWEFSTGKGRRLLYRLPKGVKVKKFKKADEGKAHEELALLGDGQQTVIPPSVHQTGKVYGWIPGKSPFECDPAPAPKWILELMVDRKSTPELPEGDTLLPTVTEEEWIGLVPEGQRQDRLKKLAGSLIGRGTIPLEEVLLFVRTWNNEHCDPPWPESELITLVTNLYHSEQTKRAARKKGEKEILRPTPFAKSFLTDQHKSGFNWCYCVENGQFYQTDQVSGPWRIIDSQYLNAQIRRALVSRNEDWDNTHRVNEVVNSMRDLLSNPKISDRLANLSLDDRLICVRNGLLDWRTGTVHPWDPNSFITTQIDASFDPSATCPAWTEALEQWVPDRDTRLFLQEFVGLCLIPDSSYRAAVFLYGAGSNGKSLFIEAVASLFGDAAAFMPLQSLSEKFDIAYLQNKLINVCGDIDPQYLKETGTLKAIIAGDKIKGEFKHGKSFYFTPVVRLIFSANELPKTRDKSEGWYSRWSFIHFPNSFERNSAYKLQLQAKLETQKSGLLNWALEGLIRVKGENRFTIGESMIQAKHDYAVENDSVFAFLEEVCDREEQKYVQKSDLYEYYKYYCSQSGLRAVSLRDFTRQMLSYGIKTQARPKRGDYRSRALAFIGVQINDQFIKDFNFIVQCTTTASFGD